MSVALVLLASAALCAGAPELPPPDPSAAAAPAEGAQAGDAPRSAPAAPASQATDPASQESPPRAAPPPPPPAPPTEPGERSAETSAHQSGHVAAAEATHRGSRWFALPVLFWLPETRLGFGVSGGLHLHLDGAPRTSSLFAGAVYTLQRQGSLDVAGDVYLPGGALLSGRARVVHFPDVFYGIGPHTTTAQREDFTRRAAELVIAAEFPIVAHLSAGPRLDLRAEEIRDRRPGSALAEGDVTGWNGYSAAALGASARWDSRDSAFWPTTGTLAQTWYVYAPEGFGRSHGFGRGVLEVSRFLGLGRGRVLGLDGYAEGAHGDPPFTLLPKLGSTHFLRGVREGRYRDRLDWAAQAELRVPVWRRLSATTFAAAGAVAPGLRDLSLRTVQVTGGAGLRFRLTEEGANIRLDLAASRTGVEVYVLVLEAF
ncbi:MULTISPECIES: outer membrane protein assembly factor [unclassified Anaeromyxobacter]|uniref:outer membrane protein assembly factor n=1 Tax=unclassified Anaeromyxobacter TaxID=2620896 RepID=UPI001F5781C9|nr:MULTISPECIES: outer membrane protein assembly factor [unclassified Anaeromyxobacter]